MYISAHIISLSNGHPVTVLNYYIKLGC